MEKKLNESFPRNYLWLSLATLFLFTIMGLAALLDADEQKKILSEGGLIESITVYLYIFNLILIFTLWSYQKIVAKWYFSALIFLFALRELDYDKAHFTHGVLKSRQYFSDLVGFPELILSIIILVFILIVLGSIILNEKNSFINGIKAKKQAHLAILVSLLLIAITKSIDGLNRKLEKFGISLSESGEQFALIFEEVGEMGIPVMFAIAIYSNCNK